MEQNGCQRRNDNKSIDNHVERSYEAESSLPAFPLTDNNTRPHPKYIFKSKPRKQKDFIVQNELSEGYLGAEVIYSRTHADDDAP